MLVRVHGICTDDSRIFEITLVVDNEGFTAVRNLARQSNNASQYNRIQARLDAFQAELDELRK